MIKNKIENLIYIVKKLRDPENGCPWNIQQTHESLLPYLLEEAYEVIYAIKNKDDKSVKEELGDLLLQIILHSVIADENKNFNLETIIDNLNKKLIRRHPHIFKNPKKLNNEELKKQWDDIKESEGKVTNLYDPFHSIIKNNSVLSQTIKISNIAKDLGFDWKNYQGPALKVTEELNEVLAETKKQKRTKIKLEEEIGDLLFSVANLSRHLDINPEIALLSANTKFIKRFNLMLKEFNNKEEFIKAKNKIKEKNWNKIKKL